MGGTESTRRIVVEDHEGTGVVKISESVVRRIKGQPVESKAPPQTQQVQKQQQQQQKGQETKHVTPKEVIVERPVYYQAPTKDQKKAIHEVETFYLDKLKQLEIKNAQLQKITTEQFAKAVQEVEQKFITQIGNPVCENLQGQVYNCYSSNPRETLNCWQEVREFSTCVDRARLNALARRG